MGLTVAPALSIFLLSNGSPAGERSELGKRLRAWYRGFAPRSLPRSRRALAIYGVVIVAGVLAVPTMSQSLKPALKERDILVHLEAAAGTSLPSMHEITGQMARELQSQPGVGNVAAHVGRAILSDQIVSVNSV